MQLRRLLLLPAPFLLAAPAHAGIDVDEQEAGMRFEIFTDSDDVHVSAQAGSWRMDLARGAEFALNLLREVVVIPGITAAPGSQEAVDSISGASRPIAATSDPYADWSKGRHQLEASAKWRGTTGGYYVSREDDYFAQQVSGGLERSFAGENLVFSAGASFGWDRIEPLEDADTATQDDHKNTQHANAMVTWVATPVTVLQGGAELTHVEGLQHNPYRNVYVDGAWVPELHPDSRSRRDVFVKASRWLPNRSAVKAEYRLYSDDWGIVSHTLGARLHQYVGGDAFVVRYRYRFYTQGAADFFREEYLQPGGVGGYRTADYRMGDFDAHLFGTKVTWNLGEAPFSQEWLDHVGVDISYERYFNSNNFSANLFEIGFGLTY